MVEKVFAYILREKGEQKQLLAFAHKDFQDISLQVLGGALEV